MTSENSVEKACGQILFSLKMSKLNYMVKETPYSAYITIRKKFVKSFQPDSDTSPKLDQNQSMVKLKRDFEILQKKNTGLLTDIAHFKYESEEFEVKVNALEKINAELEFKLERLDETFESSKKELEIF